MFVDQKSREELDQLFRLELQQSMAGRLHLRSWSNYSISHINIIFPNSHFVLEHVVGRPENEELIFLCLFGRNRDKHS